MNFGSKKVRVSNEIPRLQEDSIVALTFNSAPRHRSGFMHYVLEEAYPRRMKPRKWVQLTCSLGCIRRQTTEEGADRSINRHK